MEGWSVHHARIICLAVSHCNTPRHFDLRGLPHAANATFFPSLHQPELQQHAPGATPLRASRQTKMSTLVDELLQDFEDSGSEQGDERNEDDILGAGDNDAANGDHASGDMDLDGGAVEDGDEEMGGMPDSGKKAAEDPEEAKQRIEKMQLKGVGDVRSVAGLMKILEPVLEVSWLPISP